MATLILPRRRFLIRLASLITAPAIVRAEALMPIVVWRPTFGWTSGGGMGSWVTCPKSEMIGVDFAVLGFTANGHDWSGQSDKWYWRPSDVPRRYWRILKSQPTVIVR
jgi:hypothetical protein